VSPLKAEEVEEAPSQAEVRVSPLKAEEVEPRNSVAFQLVGESMCQGQL